MSAINRIVYECVDAALLSFEFVDKQAFYGYLKDKHNFDFSKFADKFDTVHEALRLYFGINHYRIERVIIQTLNSRAKQGLYRKSDEIAAFGCVVSIFMKETEENINRNKNRTRLLSNYAKGLELRIKEANDKIKADERLVAIGQTAAMVGHDIRNPLQAIIGELYLAKEEVTSLPDCPSKKNIEESIKNIEDNIFYINKIVSDLQDFAKPIMIVQKESVDINAVIADVLSIVPIPDNLQVQIYVETGFPIINANCQMLKRALTNLVQNAVQAISDNGKLTIIARIQREKAEIIVEDTGEGIPEEVKENLFKPLFTTKAKGQGLGLAVVKRLIEAQGGQISFDSQKGSGARFTIELPI